MSTSFSGKKFPAVECPKTVEKTAGEEKNGSAGEDNAENNVSDRKGGNYTYILQCADGTFYTGWTNNLERRLKAHNSGDTGAKYTKTRRPVRLIYYEEFPDKISAMRREAAIKKLDRAEKEKLVSGN